MSGVESFLTIVQATQEFAISEDDLRNAIANQVLHAVPTSIENFGGWIIRREHLIEYLAIGLNA